MTNSREVAVAVKDIHKEFILPQSKNSSFKQTFVNIVKRNGKVTQKTLDGVTFNVYKGDFFGIVGRNGSGKSTLLKLIAGVYSPSAGGVDVNGGLTPFIELGVGFNPELSGRDNVFLNGALLGFTRKQVAKIYDEIVDFAELGPFMDQKLKNYSSGMQVRLAFSIAIKAKSEILIFDEVLAVGDEAFQRKCLDVFEDYKAQGQTIILVTHDMDTVRRFCNRAVLIKDGKVVQEGNPRQIADKYSALNQAASDRESDFSKPENQSTIKATLTEPVTKKALRNFAISEEVSLNISWDEHFSGVDSVMVDLFKKSGEHVTGFNSAREDIRIDTNIAEVGIRLDLGPGKYFFAIETRHNGEKRVEVSYNAVEFTVLDKWPNDRVLWSGMTKIEHKWRG